MSRDRSRRQSPPRQVLSEVVDTPRWRRQSWLPQPAVEAQAAVSEQFVVLVEDAHGGVLPGANVRLSRPDPDSQPNLTAITNAAGRVSTANVPAGDYLLTAEMPGFKSSRLTLAVPSGRAWVRVRLEIGALSESITVTAAPPQQAVSSRACRQRYRHLSRDSWRSRS